MGSLCSPYIPPTCNQTFVLAVISSSLSSLSLGVYLLAVPKDKGKATHSSKLLIA